jgi:hypothetical protein
MRIVSAWVGGGLNDFVTNAGAIHSLLFLLHVYFSSLSSSFCAFLVIGFEYLGF